MSVSASSPITLRFVWTISTSLDGARGLEVAEVGEEPDAVALDEERGVRAVEADEVDDVHRVRDEQRLLERLLQACKAVVHAFSFRYSRPRR